MVAANRTYIVMARSRTADRSVSAEPLPDDYQVLVRGAVAGDRSLTEALFQRLVPRIRNLVRYLTSADAEAHDIAQEAALAVLLGLPSYRGDGPFLGWVDRSVVRITLTRRRRSRTLAARSDAARDVDEAHEIAGATPFDERYAARRRLVVLLNQLPVEQRDVLVLHHVLDMTIEEIGDQLSVPPETIRTRLRRAKARLRGLAEEESRDLP
jgi:RNA polymerase sigma-70 factor, ECF subfamily